ncbi:hypothetical protein ACHAXT_010153 [Thalassiosira profunda]
MSLTFDTFLKNPEKIASFRQSLVSLKEAMKQHQEQKAERGHAATVPDSSNFHHRRAHPRRSAFTEWVHRERESLVWIGVCMLLGALLGFGVGAGWLTRGAGTYLHLAKDRRVLGAMSAKIGHAPQRAVKQFVVSAWRADLAKRVRKSLAYELFRAPRRFFVDVTSFLITGKTSSDQHWVATSPLWPPNWILFREVDLSQIEVGSGGLSPVMVSCLSFILPWRRNLIRALARKDGASKVSLRDQDGNLIEHSSPFGSSMLSSAPSSQPINPYYHPMAFHVLREYVVRFEGFVHPDLGFLVPAPSGAERGLGMVRDSYNKCQVHCVPGNAEQWLNDKKEMQTKLEEAKMQEELDKALMDEMLNENPEMASPDSVSPSSGEGKPSTPRQKNAGTANADPMRNTTTYEGIQSAVQLQSSTPRRYCQSEILLRIPLEAQITRKRALDTLLGLLPSEMNGRSTHLEELDDAFVLTLYLAHERGLGKNSPIWPYIATLPHRPTCGLHWGWRQSVVDVVTAMSVEMGTDVQGWPNEITKAAEMSDRIVTTLSTAFVNAAATSQSKADFTENVRWALCQVSSRAIAGRESHGALRLVPVLDMINHDEAAEKFIEITGTERMEHGDILDAAEDEAGAFVVRSRRHGEKKPLRRGQELMANYNVPAYSPLDWFLNMGYIPPERAGKWTMLEAGLPRTYRGGFSRKPSPGTAKDAGAFGSGKPELQVIRQHTPR